MKLSTALVASCLLVGSSLGVVLSDVIHQDTEPVGPVQIISIRDQYQSCIHHLGDEDWCDYRVFGEIVYDDDVRFTLLCDLKGNRICGGETD
jgi:hypothetical protein